MLVEEQKSMIHEYNAAEWLFEQIDKYRLSFGFINGNCIDKWANNFEAGAVYVQSEFGKEFSYVFKILKRDSLVDFIVTKGLIDSPIFGEPIGRISPNNEYTSEILSHLSQCGKMIDLSELHKYIRYPVQLSLF